MNVTINSQKLAQELRSINRVVPQKPALAALGYALVTAADGKVSFWGTDLEVGIDGNVEAIVHEAGSMAIPVGKLLEMVERFSDGDVDLALAGSSISIKCGSFASTLQTISTADFPVKPEVNGTTCMIGGNQLAEMIAKTRYACSTSSARATLKCALLKLEGDVAWMVASDGGRLALAKSSRSGPDQQALLPTKILDVLAASPIDGDVQFTVGDRHLFFVLNGRMLVSRKMEGQFLAYEKVVRQSYLNDKEVSVDRVTWAAALRRVGVVSEDNESVYFEVSDNVMRMRAAANGVGSAAETIPVRYEGDAFKGCFKGSSILDFLNVARNPGITVKLKEGLQALFIDGLNHVCIIVPMGGAK